MNYGIILFFWLLFSLLNGDECPECHQDKEYLCAANTLPINSRICIDISEVPTFFYKDYLAAKAETFGTNSEQFARLLPDFKIWKTLLPHLSEEEIKSKFFESDELALMPLVGITLEQAEAFCEWRTEAFKAELNNMKPQDRVNFPKSFVFRLPTAAEWGRLRFLYQDKKMMKRLAKIANSNRSAFKSDKSVAMKKMKWVEDVYAVQHEPVGFFNLFGNVAEMTAEPGVAVGGSYHDGNTKNEFQKIFNYEGAQAWLGIRCVFEIID